jgi:hypothetical protein
MISFNLLKSIVLWFWQRKEALFWMAAMIFLSLSNPGNHHYTLCPLDNMGFHYCPGCGLGRSIGYLFRLDFTNSFLSHPLGIPATILLISRSVKLILRPVNLNLSTS